jgi:hypothetical protein
MMSECYCFGPAVEDCPTHGWKARRKVAHADYLQQREVNPGEAAKNDQEFAELIKQVGGIVLPHGWEIKCGEGS